MADDMAASVCETADVSSGMHALSTEPLPCCQPTHSIISHRIGSVPRFSALYISRPCEPGRVGGLPVYLFICLPAYLLAFPLTCLHLCFYVVFTSLSLSRRYSGLARGAGAASRAEPSRAEEVAFHLSRSPLLFFFFFFLSLQKIVTTKQATAFILRETRAASIEHWGRFVMT
ncbi:hypothetical protein F5Y14DRAFT_426988 [Nemania sp. NC0429]|nr:hypothetical protein F5Y14DRAFT_426988 [Nemania sp. NC0429]